MDDSRHTHAQLPITAAATYWRAAGWMVYADGTVSGPKEGTELLILALAAGQRDEAAVAWAIAEDQRRIEEDRRTSAQSAEAAAIVQLAQAIKAAQEDDILRKLLSRLTEKTQYAVRQQLGK